jgi:hypothetical protein
MGKYCKNWDQDSVRFSICSWDEEGTLGELVHERASGIIFVGSKQTDQVPAVAACQGRSLEVHADGQTIGRRRGRQAIFNSINQ